MQTKSREKLYLILIGAVLLGCLIVVGIWLAGRGEKTPETGALASETAALPEKEVVIREVEKLVEVEREVSAETVQEGLREMGVLLTGEYYFTEVVSFTSVKKLLKSEITLPFTESAYLASYDGTVTAGIDFSAVTVEKNEEMKIITVHIPASTIQSVDIDPESFELYSEKTGLGNPISAADFNQSLVELEATAREKAISRGLLKQADDTARTVIQNFVKGVTDSAEYMVRIEQEAAK